MKHTGKNLRENIGELRLRDKLETSLEETQSGSRKQRETNDQIFIMSQITERAIMVERQVYVCFIDGERF